MMTKARRMGDIWAYLDTTPGLERGLLPGRGSAKSENFCSSAEFTAANCFFVSAGFLTTKHTNYTKKSTMS
jgi:hypothetical protein